MKVVLVFNYIIKNLMWALNCVLNSIYLDLSKTFDIEENSFLSD